MTTRIADISMHHFALAAIFSRTIPTYRVLPYSMIRTSTFGVGHSSNCNRALRNGGHPQAERSPKGWRLATYSGSEGCILHDSIKRVRSEIYLFPLGQQGVLVQLPAIRAVLRPVGLTKTFKPIAAQHRQLGVQLIIYTDILIMAESGTLVRDHVMGLTFLLENLGFIVNYPKSPVTPTQGIELLGFHHQYTVPRAPPTWRQNEESTGSRTLQFAEGTTTRPLLLPREAQCRNQGYPPCPHIL